MLRRGARSAQRICLTTLLACLLTGMTATAQEVAERSVRVAVIETTRGAQTVTLPVKVGILEAAASVPISFEVSGRVARILGEGVGVQQGDEIAQLDAVLENAELERAQLLLSEARRELRRLQGLRKANAASASALDAASTAAQLRRAEHDLAQERVRRRRVLARFAGVVADVQVDPGEVVVPGKVVARLLNFDLLQVEIGVPGHQIGNVQPGARVDVMVPFIPDERFSGMIHVIAPAAAEGSVLFDVEILVPNAERRLKPGMSARAHIVSQEMANAVSIPLEASVRRNGRRVAFFVREDRAYETPLDSAVLHGDRLVFSGDAVSSMLVVRGQHDLEDGAPVVIDNSVLHGAPGGGGSAHVIGSVR